MRKYNPDIHHRRSIRLKEWQRRREREQNRDCRGLCNHLNGIRQLNILKWQNKIFYHHLINVFGNEIIGNTSSVMKMNLLKYQNISKITP